MSEQQESFSGWAIVELMGHRKLAGRVSEAVVGGGPMLRIDVFPGDAAVPVATQFYGTASIYCLTPASESLCRQVALSYQPQPVARYELPALAAARPPGWDPNTEDDVDDD